VAVSTAVAISVVPDLPPVVRITSPPNNAVFRAPVDIPLLAYAHDPGGSISTVQFFAGTNSLGTWRRPPPIVVTPLEAIPFPISNFEVIWSNAPPGRAVVVAVATDNSGLSATSAPVNLVILPQPPPPTNRPELVSIVATDPIAIAGTNCWAWLGLTNVAPSWSNWLSPVATWRKYTNCGPQDGAFTLHRGGETNSDLTVYYSVEGTASNGVDYVSLPGVATISAGRTETTITLVPNDDSTNHGGETVVLRLLASTNAPPDYLLGFPQRAEVLIINSEMPRPAAGGEFLGDRSFFLTATGPDGGWFRIDYSTDAINWVPLCTNQVVNGSIDFADPDAANSAVRLYREVPLPGPPSD
jgi:hypothetical protein